jgi:hypothetical protein
MVNTRDTFRPVQRGDVTMEVNSREQTADRFVDHSRLGSHEEWQSSGNPNKPGRIVQVPDSVERNAKRAMGAMKVRSSFDNRNRDGKDACNPCVVEREW